MKKELLLSIIQRVVEEMENSELSTSEYTRGYSCCIKDVAKFMGLNPDDYGCCEDKI